MAEKNEQTHYRILGVTACPTGIAHTYMSILISSLTFTSAAEITAAKCAILAGSVTSAVVGCIYILLVCHKKTGRASDAEKAVAKQ